MGQVPNLPHRRQVGQVGNLPHKFSEEPSCRPGDALKRLQLFPSAKRWGTIAEEVARAAEIASPPIELLPRRQPQCFIRRRHGFGAPALHLEQIGQQFVRSAIIIYDEF